MSQYLFILISWILIRSFGDPINLIEIGIYDNGEYFTNISELNARRRLSPSLRAGEVSDNGGTLWSIGVDGTVDIFYKIDFSIYSTAISEQNIIAQSYINNIMDLAVLQINSFTNIRFKPRVDQEKYIFIKLGAPPVGTAQCGGLVGKVGDGVQNINLEYYDFEKEIAPCWYVGNVIHELVHSLGLQHTQQREDRDDYLTINWENIVPEYTFAFDKVSEDKYDDCGYYDYNSIMHYPADAFGKPLAGGGEEQTMVPTTPDIELQHPKVRTKLSTEDINCLDYLYRPKTIPIRIVPYENPRKYVRHDGVNEPIQINSDVTKELSFLQSSTFRFIEPGLTGEDVTYPKGVVSFESSEHHKHYISVHEEEEGGVYMLKLKAYEDTDSYKQKASFIIVPALSGAHDYVSFKNTNIGADGTNYYVTLGSDNQLYLMNQEDEESWKNSASFRLECTFVHKTDDVDTCPTNDYMITSWKHIDCEQDGPNSILIAKGGRKQFIFSNEIERNVVFVFISDTDTEIVEPNVELKTITGGEVITADYVDKETQMFLPLEIGEYYLNVQPKDDEASGGIFTLGIHCFDR